MNLWIALACAVAGYLLGAISFARIITRIVKPDADLDDIRLHMSGSSETESIKMIGAATASILLGKKLGWLVAILDMLKVALPMLLLRWLYPAAPYALFCSVGGLVGHNWPVYYRFRGGRGWTIIIGSFLVLDWPSAPIAIVAGTILAAVFTGNPVVVSLSWTPLLIPWMVWRGGPWEIAYAVIINIIFFISILPELRTGLRYRRAGKYREYTEALYSSNARWRGTRILCKRLWLFRPPSPKDSDS